MEEKLGHIEGDASRIIARAVDAHIAGKGSISPSRADKDVLRKFLFIMKYRSTIFFERFNHDSAETYDSNDREIFLEYMQRRGFNRPLDVWFDNLMKIIVAPIDPAGRWILGLVDTKYPADALWLFININSMHLVFVTPLDTSNEFILTGNAFGIHEGPTSYSIDRFTGKRTSKAYTEFHLLNIISPHLAVILRHNTMQDPVEDMNPNIRNQKGREIAEQALSHIDSEHATSLLHDLPVTKPLCPHTISSNAWLNRGRHHAAMFASVLIHATAQEACKLTSEQAT